MHVNVLKLIARENDALKERFVRSKNPCLKMQGG